MHPTAQKVAAAAHQFGLDIHIKEFEASTRTAEDAAQAIGCSVAQIAKMDKDFSFFTILGPV